MMGIAAAWEAFSLWDFGRGHTFLIIQTVAIFYLIGLVAYFIERIRPAEPAAKFFKSDFKTEVGFPLFNLLVTTPLFALVAFLFTAYVLEPFAPFHIFETPLRHSPLALQVFVILLFGDLAVYVEHRISHGILWDYHSLHHVTREVNWLTHARLHPINALTIALVGLVTFFVFGLDGKAIAIATVLANLIAIWEHLNLDFAWPRPLNFLIVSPRFHRWHHADEAEAIDKNFALVFPFIDVIFGTYYCPERLPRAYGIPHAEPGDPGIPDGFFGQLAYPFTRTWMRLRPRKLVVSASTPPRH